MCGIVGYVGPRDVQALLLAGLEKLEYRGYDSAGISILNGDGIESVRAVGNLQQLFDAVDAANRGGENTNGNGGHTNGNGVHTGIGHTRWATHGKVTIDNAHPHFDPANRVHVAANGIVENYVELRAALIADGAVFTSETDVEVIAHLIAKHYDGDLVAATRATYGELTGHFAFVAMSAEEPGVVVGARNQAPLLVGRGEHEQFIGSAIPAFLNETSRVQYVNDGELVVIRPDGVEFLSAAGEELQRDITEIEWDLETAEKGGFDSFMLKEIYEQPEAVAETIGERVIGDRSIDLGDLGAITDELLRTTRRIVVVACGTAYHAGLFGRYAIEEWTRIPVEVEVASEYRYRNPVIGPGDLVIGISQSGETADTLAALRGAKERGASVLAITNIMGSEITRQSDGVLYTRAGLEVSVPSTKAFLAQVTAMYLLALRIAELRGTLDDAEFATLVSAIKAIPEQISEMLDPLAVEAQRLASHVDGASFFMYLGRHIGLPAALEGALKLKEVSYIATDSYAAGEMKHGPIALLDSTTPVVAIATESPVLEKLISNVQEVRARGAKVIAVATEGNTAIGEHAEEVMYVPKTHWMLAPMLAVVPLQLFAYAIATRRGLNVDQPRNLAKTVTVE